MSTPDAIYGVTNTLIQLLTGPLHEVNNSASPTALLPDKVTDGLQEGQSRVNLFLYQTMVNTGWNNLNPPAHSQAGELKPPLALNLYYLLSVYADDNPELSQRLLGRAMTVLHNNAELTRQTFRDHAADMGLDQQIDRVFIAPFPLSIDEMSKLWSTFQTQYRTSTAYQVSVVLIDSESPRAPLPVLRRGPEDQGVISQADMIPPLPTLTEILLPDKQPSLLLADVLTVKGHKLRSNAGTPAQLNLRHHSLAAPATIEARAGSTAETIIASPNDLPDAGDKFPPGYYQVAVRLEDAQDGEVITRTTNTLGFPLAVQIETGGAENLNDGLNTPDADTTTLTLNFSPKVWPDQQALLLLGSHVFEADGSRTDPTDILTFTISTAEKKLPAGTYRVRLRVDGVDSHLIQDYAAVPLSFDETLTVTIADE